MDRNVTSAPSPELSRTFAVIANVFGLTRSRTLFAALLASLVIFVAGAAVGYSSINSAWAAESLDAGGSGPVDPSVARFLGIFVRNLGAIMLLYSGALTLGLTSVFGLATVSAYVGATVAVGVGNVGAWQIVSHTGSYALIEFSACIVAAAAGIYPVFAAIGRVFTDGARTTAFGAYLRAVSVSLKIFAWSAVLVLVAGCIEIILIAIR